MQSTERWLPVVGFEGAYEISDLGRVKSVRRLVAAGRGRMRVQVEKISSPNTHQGGYKLAHLWKNNRRTARFVHRMVLEAFVGPAPDGTEACHADGDPSNNRLTNLRWDTHSANNRDQVAHGTHPWSSKKTCPRGHLLVAGNLVPNDLRKGFRRCLACTRARNTKSEPFSDRLADERYAVILKTLEMVP